MKILLLHSDYISFEPKKKAIKTAEVVKKVKKTVKDCLVVFSSVEKGDEKILNNVAESSKWLSMEFKIFIVQPGLSISKASEQQLRLLTVTDMYLKDTLQIPLGIIANK